MRTLHVGLRVSDRERSVAYYSTLGYAVVSEVPGTPASSSSSGQPGNRKG